MTKARNWVEEPATQVVCFICQRMTARAYKGKKDAFDDAGVWFQNKDSWQRICWCPRCIFDLQEPDAALRSWLSRDPRYHTEDWEQAEGLTEEMVNQFMRNWRDPPDGPQPPRPLAEILEEESRPEEADGTAAPPPPPAGARPPASDANDPPGPPLGDGPQAAIGDIQGGVGPGHGAAGAEGAPRSSGDSSRENEKMKNLEQKVEELSGKLQRHTEFVQDFKSFCEFLEKKVVGDAYVQISELHNEVKSLGQQVAELKGEVSKLKKGAEGTDENAAAHISELRREESELKEEVSELKKIVEQFSTSAAFEITQLKQQVAKLQEEVSWWHKWQPDRTGEC